LLGTRVEDEADTRVRNRVEDGHELEVLAELGEGLMGEGFQGVNKWLVL